MPDRIARDVTYVIIGVFTALLNIIEIVLISRKKNRKVFEKLLISLAASDVLVGMAAAAFKLLDLITDNQIKWLSGGDIANIFLISTTFSIANIGAITVDRYLAIRFPIKHRMIVTARRVDVTIVVLWFLCLVSTILNSFLEFQWIKDFDYMLYVGTVSLLAFSVAMTMMYAAIFWSISKRTMRTATENVAETNSVRRGFMSIFKGLGTTEKSVLFTGCLVTISFIICTYPFAFEFLIRQSGKGMSTASRLMLLLNSLLNPIIYFFMRYHSSRTARQATAPIETN